MSAKDDRQRDPTWDGEVQGWQNYVRMVRLQYEQTPRHKRKLLGPRLALRLTHKAWDITQSISHDQLRQPNGAKYLLLYLRERLGKTPIPDAGQKLEELFLRLRRSPGTSMAAWASQLREAYRGVQRALARTQADAAEKSGDSPRKGHSSPAKSSRPREDAGTPSARSEPLREPPSPSAPREEAGDSGQYAAVPTEDPDERAHGDGEDDGWWSSRQWWQGWQGDGRGRWKRHDDSGSESEGEFEDLLGWADLEVFDNDISPPEILGWLLLRRSGLPASSRLAVQSSVSNSLHFEDLERALRDQEEELLQAEAQRTQRHVGRRTYWVEENGDWGLINEDVDEDALALTSDSILWAQSPPPLVPEPAYEDVQEEETWYYDGQYEWSYHTDGEWYAAMDDGSYVAYSKMKPWMEIEEISYHDASLGKELAETFIAVHEKMRTFQEARHAVQQKGKNRGFFKPKGKGKSIKGKGTPTRGKGTVLAAFHGKGKGSGPSSNPGTNPQSSNLVNRPGYKGCFICGGMDHEFRSCPRRQMQPNRFGKGGKPVFMVMDVANGDDTIEVCPANLGGFLDDPGAFAAECETSPSDRLRFAVIDTGATETVGSMDALDRILTLRQELYGPEQVTIDTKVTKEFRFGNGQTRAASSFVYLPQVVNGEHTTLGVFAIDVPNIPVLVGIKTLQRLGAVMDIGGKCLEFQHLFPGCKVPLIRGANGHLLLDLCCDWCPQVTSIPEALENREPHVPTMATEGCTEEKQPSLRVLLQRQRMSLQLL